MGKRWIVLLVIALVGILATTAFAEPKMVIVLDPNNPSNTQCYRVGNFDPMKPTPMPQTCSDDPISQPQYVGGQWKHKIRDKHHSDPNFSDHVILGIIDKTIIYSNPCVTYWFSGKSYTVCY